MCSFRILAQSLLLISIQLIIVGVHETRAAPSSYNIASTGGSGAVAGTDDDGQAVAMSGTLPRSGYSSGSSNSLLSRSGGSGSSQQRSQSVMVGSNGDTTIVQQNGDQPPKVYKISG